jgi:hypothetical protein
MNRQAMMTAVVAAMLIVNTTTARAQTSPRRGYVEGGMLADFDPDTYAEGTHTAPAATFAAGYTFPSHWSVRVEGVLPAWHTNTVNESFSFAGRTTTDTGTEQHRLSTYSFLTGYEFSIAPRVRLTPLVGVGLSRHTDKLDLLSQMRASSGAITTQSEVSSDAEWLTAISYGADFSISVSPRLAIVPQIRFDTTPGFSAVPRFRPGVAVRVGF